MTTKKKTTGKATHKQSGAVSQTLKFAASEVVQTGHKFYVFKTKASVLYAALSINRRIEEKDEGYQRVLSASRVQAITRHLTQKRPIPTAIIVSFDNATFDASKGELKVPKGSDVGWVIDGQHRLVGAELASRAGVDILKCQLSLS